MRPRVVLADRRPVAAEERQRRRRASRSPGASATRSCRPRRRSPRCVLDATDSVHRSALRRVAGRRARRLDRRRGRRPPDRLAALDPLRHQRPGGAERVAPLAARPARGASGRDHRELPARRAVRRRRRGLAAAGAIANPKASVQTTLVGDPAGVGRRGDPPSARGLDGTATLAHFPRDDRRRLSRALVEFPLPVVRLARIHVTPRRRPAASRSPKSTPGRWRRAVRTDSICVGEILDVDGRIGGFNFQWAWSSGFVAGPRPLAADLTPTMSAPTLSGDAPAFLFWGFKSSHEILESCSRRARARGDGRRVEGRRDQRPRSVRAARIVGRLHARSMTTMDRLFKEAAAGAPQGRPRVRLHCRRDAQRNGRRRRDGAGAEPAAAAHRRAAPSPVIAGRRGFRTAIAPLLDDLERLIREKRRSTDREKSD